MSSGIRSSHPTWGATEAGHARSCSWTRRPSRLGRLAGLRPAGQRAGPWRGRKLRAHAQGAPRCFTHLPHARRGAGGACSSRIRGPRGPWNSPVWASVEEGPPCLGTLLSLARCAWGHQRGGRKQKGLVWPWLCYGRNSASMRGMRPPAWQRRTFLKTSSQTSPVHPPVTCQCLLVRPRRAVCSE